MLCSRTHLLVPAFIISVFTEISDAGKLKRGTIGNTVENDYISFMKGLPVPYCRAKYETRYPTMQSEVVDIVREAIELKTRVKAYGCRHSTTDLICTDGIPVDMTRITDISYNGIDKTVTVGAGMTLRKLCEYLVEHGRAINGIPAYGNITVGGALGAGSHGSTIKRISTIAESVVGLVIVDGRGNLRRITSAKDLQAFRLHLGLLGIIVQVIFQTVQLFKVQAHNSLYPSEILTNGTLVKLLRNADSMAVYWFPAYDTLTVSHLTFVDVNTPGDAYTNDHVPNVSFFNAFYLIRHLEVAQAQNSTEFLNFLQSMAALSLTEKVPTFPPIYTEDSKTVKNPAVGLYYKMIAPVCGGPENSKQCPWYHGQDGYKFMLQEISIDLDHFPKFVNMIYDILRKVPAVFPYQGILLRFSEPTKTLMSTTQGKEVVNFEFYVPLRLDSINQPTLGLAAYQAIMQTALERFGGRAHWGKTGGLYHSAAAMKLVLKKRNLNAFRAKMKEYDPNRIFLNSFGKRVLGESEEADIDPAVKHCALLDACKCQFDADCADGQSCSHIKGYPDLPICLSPWHPKAQIINLAPLMKRFHPLLNFFNSIINAFTPKKEVTLN